MIVFRLMFSNGSFAEDSAHYPIGDRQLIPTLLKLGLFSVTELMYTFGT